MWPTCRLSVSAPGSVRGQGDIHAAPSVAGAVDSFHGQKRAERRTGHPRVQGTTAKAASEESNGRLAALQGVKAALSGVQAVQGGQLAAVYASDQNAIGISLSYGRQSSKSEQTVNQTTHQGSTLTAGNNQNITATGNGVKGADGDIVVQGSQLKTGGDTTLDAARDILLLGAANTQKTDGSNSSSGGSVCVSVWGSVVLAVA
ncbi:putative adhesin/hemolysin precursor [Yersinia frederiksenii]|nr:putative adhesin/hemolysin precursor [Yersinia frederiksenii]